MKLLKNKKTFIVLILLIVILGVCAYFIGSKIEQEPKIPEKVSNLTISENISVVATMNDKISTDTTWCGTFQLVWNDLVNEVVKQDVRFEEQLEIVDNLNKQDFTEKSISEEYYYKKFGLKTLDLKAEIEKGIKEKFNETSDVLDDIDWSEDALNQKNPDESRYIFYAMLKRDFSYPKEFTKLENGKFANQYENIKYFGIDDSTDNEVRKQVDVLYYNSEDDCAVVLNTVEGDEVILCRGTKNNTFNEIYDEMMKKSNSYQGQKTFENKDFLKVPKIDFNIKKEYTELQNKEFPTADGDLAEIEKAIQSIQMSMDSKGGSIKSEAVMDVTLQAAMIDPKEAEPRYFNFDDEYILFLKEDGKDKPYFAAHISDITKFQ